MDEAITYQRIWKTGRNTDVITIKKEIMKLLKAKRGDTIMATIKKIENTKEDKEEEVLLPTTGDEEYDKEYNEEIKQQKEEKKIAEKTAVMEIPIMEEPPKPEKTETKEPQTRKFKLFQRRD